jgi:hypothetical protein
MPDSYSDCKKLAAPSPQHLRGDHVTRAGNQPDPSVTSRRLALISARLLRKSFPIRHLFVVGARQTADHELSGAC